MPNYPRIIAEMSRLQWAITPDAMGGLVAAVKGDLASVARDKFHGASEPEHQAATTELGALMSDSRFARVKGRVGSLMINGPIVPRASAVVESSGIVSVDRLTTEFRALEDSDEIESILLVLDSPGGAVTGISEFAALIAGCSKHVTAYVYGSAASAAYWIASAADKIVSSPTGITGSIGAFLSVKTDKDNDEITIVSSQSPKKVADPKTKEGRAQIGELVDGLAEVFISAVATNRGVSMEKVLSDFGQGGSMVAAQALEAGLIDKIDTLANTISPKSNNSNGTIMAKGSTTKEQKMPTLQELVALHPSISGDIAAIEKAAREDGAATNGKETKERIEGVMPILASAEYPDMLHNMALKVISGDQDLAALLGAVAVFDMLKEQNLASTAVGESVAAVATPAPEPGAPALSEDGNLNSTLDIDAEIRELRGEVE